MVVAEAQYFRLGGRFQCVRDYLRSKTDVPQGIDDFRKAENRLGTIALHRTGPDTLPEINEGDDSFIARIVIGILQRGDAAHISPWLEQAIVQRGLGLEIFEPDSTAVGGPVVLDHEPEDLIAALLRSPYQRRQFSIGRFDSEKERQAFTVEITGLLGPGLALLEQQRPLVTMLHPDDARSLRIADHRVDFALESPTGFRLVLEVDGSQHEAYAHALADTVRDQALMRNGWRVVRIPTYQLREGRYQFSLDVVEAIEKDRVLRVLRDSVADGTLISLAQAPHAIARYQFAVLYALYAGDLSLSMPRWQIGVIEREFGIAESALGDLHATLSRLCSLYQVPAPPPMQLLVVANPHTYPIATEYSPAVTLTPIARDELTLSTIDLILDVSVTLGEDDLWDATDTSVEAAHLGTNAPIYRVNTASDHAQPVVLPWGKPRAVVDHPNLNDDLLYFLIYLFRRCDFRPLQLEIIVRAMQRKDVLGLLPTGGGKSLTFQLATMLSPGIAIIVAPLRSLIDDQVYNLHLIGINRVQGIHGGMRKGAKEKALTEIASAGPRFVYIAPERFQIEAFRSELLGSELAKSVVFGVIDEAHCVSEWGHNFRPSYLSVGQNARKLFAPPGETIPLIALTATASTTVLADIQRELQFDPEDSDAVIEVESHTRDNLTYVPIPVPDRDKPRGLQTALKLIATQLGKTENGLVSDDEHSGLVFARYINGPYGVMGVRSHLAKTGLPESRIGLFAGSRPKEWHGTGDWDIHKQRTQRDFKENKFPLLVSTSAFGMGIDKANIRYTIHYGIPDSTEALVQESGRSGRDGRLAVCVVIYSPEQDGTILNSELSSGEVRDLVKRRGSDSDARRVLYLNTISYPGEDVEAASINDLLQRIWRSWLTHNIQAGQDHLVVIPNRTKGDDKASEKAVYRLKILGLVDDYTIDYSKNQIYLQTRRIPPVEVNRNLEKYFSRYPLSTFSRQANVTRLPTADDVSSYEATARLLIEFTYDQLERARRQALQNLVSFMEEAGEDGNALRDLLMGFLTRNVFTADARRLSQSSEEAAWFDLLDKAQHRRDVADLARAVQRQLESEANHPGLRMIFLIGSAETGSMGADQVVQEMTTVVSDYRQDRTRSAQDLEWLLIRMINALSHRAPDIFDDIVRLAIGADWGHLILTASHDHIRDPELRAVCAVPTLRSVSRVSRELLDWVEGEN